MLLALLIAILALPFFNNLSGKTLQLPFANPLFWLTVLVATFVMGILSGSYPAFFMSKFTPVKVLKGGGTNSVGGARVRNSLVVFQFAISVFLIVSTLVVYRQLRFIQNKELGFSKDQTVVVKDAYMAGDQIQSLKQRTEQLASVKGVTLSSFYPTPSGRNSRYFVREDAPGQENTINMQHWNVDYDYIPVMGLEIVAGRSFNKEFGADSTAVVINETALKKFGVTPEKALGMRITTKLREADQEAYSRVIGVVKNFHFESMHNKIGALCLSVGGYANAMAVKLSTDEYPTAMAQLQGIWNQMVPGQPFDYYFMDASFNDTYRSEQRLGRIFMVFTFLSIVIACLGLFGLAAFNAQKRTKEIGVRKVFGASVGQISMALTLDFLRLVGIAVLISLPIGWFAMNKWLEGFSYRIEIPFWIMALAALLAIVIAIITVSYQAIKAAIVNPVKSLRTE